MLSLLYQRNIAPVLARFTADLEIKKKKKKSSKNPLFKQASLYYIKSWQTFLYILQSLISLLFSSRYSSPSLFLI